jgi:hypothetical protein
MRPYYSDFFSYTTSVSNYVTTGTLAAVTGASATLGQTGYCAKGAFLRETGRRLYPNVNPGISTLMVGVYDFATGLHGFIDPNSLAFTPQNTDRAYYIDSAGYNPNSADAPLSSDQGPPVYTHGDVKADGNLVIGGDVKFKNPTTVGTTAMNPADDYTGGFQRHAVSGVNYNSTTSHVFLTAKGQGNPSLIQFYSIEPTKPGTAYVPSTFYIVSRQVSSITATGTVPPPTGLDTTTFNYMIVNES